MSTEYVVLYKNDDAWKMGQPVISARSAREAVRLHVAEDKESSPVDGTYVAVPLRSWNPVTVKVETKRELKIS